MTYFNIGDRVEVTLITKTTGSSLVEKGTVVLSNSVFITISFDPDCSALCKRISWNDHELGPYCRTFHNKGSLIKNEHISQVKLLGNKNRITSRFTKFVKEKEL